MAGRHKAKAGRQQCVGKRQKGSVKGCSGRQCKAAGAGRRGQAAGGRQAKAGMGAVRQGQCSKSAGMAQQWQRGHKWGSGSRQADLSSKTAVV